MLLDVQLIMQSEMMIPCHLFNNLLDNWLAFTVLAICNSITCQPFSVARFACYAKGRFSPRYAPLRALAWGYDCIALRAMSLRDGISLPDNDNFHKSCRFLSK